LKTKTEWFCNTYPILHIKTVINVSVGGSLGPPGSTSNMASRWTHPFLHRSWLCLTDHGTLARVSEQFLNGTSAHNRPFQNAGYKHVEPCYGRTKIYTAHMSSRSSSYQLINLLRARTQPQLQIHQLPPLLPINGTDICLPDYRILCKPCYNRLPNAAMWPNNCHVTKITKFATCHV